MSSLQLPRTPAWEGQPPIQPVFVSAPDEVNAVICERLDIDGPVWKFKNNSNGLAGYYRVSETARHPALFIKIVEQSRAQPLISADPIACYVADKGITAACLISNFTKPIGDDHFALTYPYHEARFAQLLNSDMSNLGATLGRLHNTLSEAPFRQKVKENAFKREALLRDTQLYLEQADQSVVVRGEVLQILKRGTLRYPHTGWPEQVIHGDMNYGNVLFPTQTPDQPLILDFEDTALSWHSPLVDIAFVIERFILMRTADDTQAYCLAENLINAYISHHPEGLPPVEQGCLVELLKSLSIRALCLLLTLELKGITVTQNEWGKFVFLHSQAQKRNKLINSIETLLRP
jgi:hypothetical protein